jgi:hypothetical protein
VTTYDIGVIGGIGSIHTSSLTRCYQSKGKALNL